MPVASSLLFFQWITLIQCGLVTLLTDLKNSCNPDLLTCKSWVTYTTENDPVTYLINIEGEIFKPGLNNLMVNFKIYHKPIGKQNESTKVVEMNTNLCSYFKKPKRGDIFTGYFKSLVQKYGKIPSCPIKPGLYYVHNLTLNDFVLPRYSELLVGNSDASFVFKYYVTYRKKVVSLVNMTFEGGYRNT